MKGIYESVCVEHFANKKQTFIGMLSFGGQQQRILFKRKAKAVHKEEHGNMFLCSNSVERRA